MLLEARAGSLAFRVRLRGAQAITPSVPVGARELQFSASGISTPLTHQRANIAAE